MSASTMIGLGLVFTLKDQVSNAANSMIDRFQKLGNVSEKTANQMRANMDGIGTGMGIAAAGAAILAPLGAAVSASMDFNKAVSAVGAVANASAEDLQKFKAQAMELGESTAFTAKQVAEGQKFLAMAGFNINQTIEAMPAMLNLAAAGSIDLGKAADVASNAMGIFGLQASEAARAADVLAAGSTSSNTTIESLGESIKYYAGAIRSYNIPIEEAVAQIGLLGNAGLQGSVATAALSTAMSNLADPTHKSVKALKAQGIEVFNNQGEFIGMSNVIREMTKASSNMTQQQEAAFSAAVFGANAMKNGLVLSSAAYTDLNGVVHTGAEAMEAYTKHLESSEGAAERMAQMLLDNLSGSLEIVKSGMMGLLINIGDKLEPYVRKAADAFSSFLGVMNSIIKSPFGDFIIGATAVIGGLVTVVGLGIAGFNAFQFAMLAVRSAIMALQTSLIPTIVAAKAALVAFAPFIAVGALVGGAVYGMVKAYQSFQNVLNGTEAPANGFLGFMQKVGGAIHSVMEIWKTATSEGFEISGQLYEALESIGMERFATSIGTMVVRIKAFLSGMRDGISGVWKNMQGMFSAFQKTGDAVVKAFTPLFDIVGKLLGDVPGLTGEVDGFKAAGEMAFKVMSFGINAVITGLELLAHGITFVVSQVSTFANFFIDSFNAVNSHIDDFKNGLISFPEMMSGIGSAMIENLLTALKAQWANVTTFFTDAIGALPFGDKILGMMGVSPTDEGAKKAGQGVSDLNKQTVAAGLSSFNPMGFGNDVDVSGRSMAMSPGMGGSALKSDVMGDIQKNMQTKESNQQQAMQQINSGEIANNFMPNITVSPQPMPSIIVEMNGEKVAELVTESQKMNDSRL